MRHLLPIALLLILICSSPGLTAGPRMLFDQGHGQAFTIEQDGELQLGQLADQFRSSGWQVGVNTGPLTPEILAGIDALIISGAFKPLNDAEISAIGRFLQNGGRLAIMLHIAQPLVPLLGKLGVASANGVVREGDNTLILDQEPLNFKVSNLADHPLNKDLSYFALYGGWPLLPTHDNARAIATTSPTAWVDLNRDKILSLKDAMQEFGVLVTGSVGEGEFAVFADDAIFQNRFLTGENAKLAENLSRWMMQGKAQAGMKI
ncbi:MAG: DUF4350 domain-containing protein [Desulfuromonas sp.]|jgi:hypothetical protein|nr:MAG: DUF4350 domain-containing protein [Desulfuromonas sp.]